MRLARNPLMKNISFSILIVFASTICTMGQDWSQWRGVERQGIWHEDGIIDQFPDDGLKVKWRVPIGSGYAGPAVANGRVFALDWTEDASSRTLDGTERLLVLDEETGGELWTAEWQTSYRALMGSYAIGPRATPTVDGDSVFVVGATGRLLSFDVTDGSRNWVVDYVEDYDMSVPPWGMASAPLVDDSRLIAIVGGHPDALVVAFDKRTGQEVWRALDVVSESGYGQPVIYEAGGVRQLIIWHPTGLTSLSPETGEVYWEQPFETGDGMTVATPVKSGSYLLVSQLYNGSLMMRLNEDSPRAELLWQGSSNSPDADATDGLHSLTTTPIVIDDYVYGVGSYGELRGLDARTGERLWMSDQLTMQEMCATAFFVRNGDRYFVNSDDGQLVIARFTPQGYVELDRTDLIAPTAQPARGHCADRLFNWVHPAYANGHIVQRNDHEILRASLTASDY